MQPVDVIYLAAGQGTRARLGYPKQLARVGGKPIMVHVLELFERMPAIRCVVAAVIPGRLREFSEVLEQYGLGKVVCIEGGATRQESSRLALEHCITERVMVHEAVRPFVTEPHVLGLLGQTAPSVVAAVEVVPTVFHRGRGFPRREDLLEVQTPQVFDRLVLLAAHALAADRTHFTDDSSMVHATGGPFPEIVPGLEENVKITSALDLTIAEAIHEARCGHHGS